ncbi:hypothetical protein O181_125868 [Austropuccinia psidii MF-1]|uniref:Uncharacterized protein n=1 Tax=Austropuccinia psidii MF-1 TaxID=1389203 RepID=A0A9Q3KQG4_9BASI|nr:hypothetical protein [Austropuccinia psidii MF-1]
MEELTQSVTPRDNSKAPAFKTPSMKAPDSFDGTQAHKLRLFIKSYPSYILNNLPFFESQPFTLFGDPNEVRKAEQELDNLRMKESCHVSLVDTRYHERQKEKCGNQEKNLPVNGTNPSKPPQNSSSKRPHQKKNKKGRKFKASKDKPHAALLNKDNRLISSEKERRIEEGLCTSCGGKQPIEKCFKRPQNKPGSS